MKIDVITHYLPGAEYELANQTVIVIDVLRCTSAIIHAVEAGCEKVIPVLEPEDAISLAESLGRSRCVIGGERGCNKLPGFDVGNSPFEYDREMVEGKTVVISTSNGTSAIRGSESANTILIGAMSNCAAVAAKAIECGRDITLMCSGTNHKLSADDLCASGSIINAMLAFENGLDLTDAAMVCLGLYKSWKENKFDLLSALHCQRLIRLGYGKDVDYCLSENTSSVVPVCKNGQITL